MNNILKLQEELVKEYNYQKLPKSLSRKVREYYLKNIPKELNLSGNLNFEIKSKDNTLIATGYNRIVIGDYGVFIECSDYQIIKDNLKIKEGQEYRIINTEFRNRVKYFWLTAKDNSNIKVYHQQKLVSYADYISFMYYISPYEILTLS